MRDYLELTKPRITILILVCACVGYVFGCSGVISLATMLNVLLGTALMASGTAALNQAIEAEADARMRRTKMRPLPMGRIRRSHAVFFGTFLSLAGLAQLWLGTNKLAAGLGLFTLLAYLLVYTPLKPRSAVCTTVGAIPGAMPPLIGYAAGSGELRLEGWVLFLILFLWQFPHFYSIAWIYRDDYARGGIRMLPVIEPSGESTSHRIVAATLLLLPVGLLPRLIGMAGSSYTIAVAVGTLMLLLLGIRFDRQRTATHARHILVATVLYLPVVLLALLADRRNG